MAGVGAIPLGTDLARGVPADYDGSTPLPSGVHEKFASLIAAGAKVARALVQAHPKGDSLARPEQSGHSLAIKEHIKRRVRFLREEKARIFASEEGIFAGFVDASERTMTAIAELIEICNQNGLTREAASARAALGSLAGRTFTHRDSMADADQRSRYKTDRTKEVLKELLRK